MSASTIEDFGMSALHTLSNVGTQHRASCHAGFWTTWDSDVSAYDPALRSVRSGDVDPSDPGATHVLEGERHTRLGCRLIEAVGPVRGGVVVLHGYGQPDPLTVEAKRYESLAARGTSVLLVRMRGFSGSRLDCGDLTSARGGWIAQGLEAIDQSPSARTDWVLSLAVADVIHAIRALRKHLGGLPICLKGESFGAGLAIIAASQLTGVEHSDIERVCVGLPTFGDWWWRLGEDRSRLGHANAGLGVGAEVGAVLPTDPDKRAEMLRTLELFDAAIHARHVRCPVLCKLAIRDEVVPAPTQAAVFNSLGAGPGEKWRFVVPVGHAEDGIANARRHALFERAAMDFLDLSQPASRAMTKWEPLLTGGERPEDLKDAGTLFGESGTPEGLDRELCEAYERTGRTLDDLPYTSEFEQLMLSLGDSGLDRRDVFHRLHNLRKAGKLPKVGRSGATAQAVTPEVEDALRGLVIEHAGTLGQRDRLPYTEAFDRLVGGFNSRAGLDLKPYDVWRLVAKLAK